MNLGLHERIAIALLELCSDFGVEESRGTLLRVFFSQKDIANLVGARGQESPSIWRDWNGRSS
jgi:CRP-like cAMP-binding protein